ncbi:hypothetical protein SPH27_22850 (plasmid) [Enterobacter sp. A103]|nr:hypothetical protein [Enterobacter sp. A103]
MNEFFAMRNFGKHSDKTFIGRIEHGTDWLGVDFDSGRIAGLSQKAVKKHREKTLRLYLQCCIKGYSHKEALLQIAQYRQRWKKCSSLILV